MGGVGIQPLGGVGAVLPQGFACQSVMLLPRSETEAAPFLRPTSPVSSMP